MRSEYRQSQRSLTRYGKMTFAQALRLAWKVEKREVERENMKLNSKPVVKQEVAICDSTYNAMVAAHYSNAPRGTYFGD